MPELSFDISWEHCACANPLESATYGGLVIRLAGVPITEVRDDAARTTRQVVRVSAYPLALWLASAWWRLRWEGPRPDSDWRQSHQLASASSGYVWPDVTFESDGEFIHVDVRPRSRVAWEPVSYLNHGRASIAVSDFETTIATFIEVVLARLAEMGHLETPLAELWATVCSESRDSGVAASRRLEAILGFDAEEAPSELLRGYSTGAGEFGEEAVMELAAIATNTTPPDWSTIAAGLQSGAHVRVQNYVLSKDRAARAARELPAGSEPWERGESAARAVRGVLGTPRGVLSNETLKDWLGSDPRESSTPSPLAAMARREQPDAPDLRVCYRSTHPDGRRFELARLLGDHLIAAGPADRLLPATRAKTARQRVQRAFAAELLLPWEDLVERVGESPDAESIEAAAFEFGVSPLLVRTRLVAKRVLLADTLDLD